MYSEKESDCFINGNDLLSAHYSRTIKQFEYSGFVRIRIRGILESNSAIRDNNHRGHNNSTLQSPQVTLNNNYAKLGRRRGANRRTTNCI